MVEVSVVIPTKNEEQSIGKCLEKVQNVFKKNKIDGEIIVSDSSTDQTPVIARSYGARVVTPDKLGYGYAYLHGFKHARGDYIIIGDADNTYDFYDIPRLLEPLKKGEADMVIGSRLRGTIKKGSMPWLHQYIGNPLLTFILNRLFKAGVSDSHSGFRSFTKDALLKMNLRTTGMEFASEMIIEATRNKLRIAEVPIVYHPREGNSELSSFSDGWRHLKFMFVSCPKYLFTMPGIILFMAGLSVMLLTMAGMVLGFAGGSILTFITGSLFAIVGYQLFALGIFADIHAYQRGYSEINEITKSVLGIFKLERFALAGTSLFGVGMIPILHILTSYTREGYEVLKVLDPLTTIIALTAVVIGVQTVFYSFFLAAMSE